MNEDKNNIIGFGLAHIRGEGKPLHPDDINCEWSEEGYARQLDAYNKCYGVETSGTVEGKDGTK
jgi:hypothetical protein